MATRDTGTEQLIKDTAKQIFFAEGRFNATTQDIADAAGVARTVINYYFRSKDILFQQVFKEAMADTGTKMNEVLGSDMPFKKKVIAFIDMFTAELTMYPYKESFLISEINAHGFSLPTKDSPPGMQQFLEEVKQAADNGEIKKVSPINFMINMLSLVAYPLLTRRLFERMLELDDTNFEKLMQERKKMIIDILFS
ncbi:TetR family transcriptional regulator [Mucilaginibacter frigoritolerans]|uniref:TetR family transcriptional regulator n=1 Tax=Mucilaginibacter frigoritolerans TaxID=652788 RepID=A0A562UCZ3_9SPHI|nr:TetR/AcrR family transcriptional regulator [Mucilaginibacter frigoritolerans]TWJ03207.1 TetR family transcriptional regulator [Mucilaginibacter frigoritolerans]